MLQRFGFDDTMFFLYRFNVYVSFCNVFMNCAMFIAAKQAIALRSRERKANQRDKVLRKAPRRMVRKEIFLCFFQFDGCKNSFVLTFDRVTFVSAMLSYFAGIFFILSDIKEEAIKFIREWLSIQFNCWMCMFFGRCSQSALNVWSEETATGSLRACIIIKSHLMMLKRP